VTFVKGKEEKWKLHIYFCMTERALNVYSKKKSIRDGQTDLTAHHNKKEGSLLTTAGMITDSAHSYSSAQAKLQTNPWPNYGLDGVSRRKTFKSQNTFFHLINDIFLRH